MLLPCTLGIVAFLTGAFVAVLTLAVIGVRQGDRSKWLTGQPTSPAEAFARRLLTGSRGLDSRDDAEDGR
jgi:hypothetical protein